MEDHLRNNENHARFKNDSVNRMSPRSADGSVAGGAIIDPNCVPGREQPPGILGAPINSDPHRHGRHSNNISQKPPERPGSHYAEENRRRIFGRDVKYR